MTMHAEYVRTGAAAGRRASTKNPLEVLCRLRDGDPIASLDYQFAKWTKAVERDSECHKAVMLYAFRNYWSALDKDAAKSRGTAQERAEAAAGREANLSAGVEKIKEQIKTIVLLELILPNGKALRDCTGKECAEAGGLFAKIASKVKPTEIVGVVLSEAEVRKLYGDH